VFQQIENQIRLNVDKTQHRIIDDFLLILLNGHAVSYLNCKCKKL